MADAMRDAMTATTTDVTRPTLDILVPVHNNLKWVSLCVQAVQSFTQNSYRLVLIDNASDSDTQDWLNDVQEKNVRIHVLWRGQNDSFSASINAGLACTKPNAAPFTVFLNSDAIVTPGWDKAMVAEAGRPEIGMTGASDGTFTPGQDVGVSYLIFFAVCARRELLDAMGPLDDETCPGWGGGEDLDLSWRIVDVGKKLMTSRANVFHGISQTYAERGVAAEAKRDAEFATKERLKKKHGEARFVAGLKTRPIVMLGRLSRTEYLINSYVDCCTFMYQTTGSAVLWLHMNTARSLVDWGRNAICEHALEKGADYVLFIDDDMTFESNLLLKLMAHDKDIVSAWAYQRGEPHNPVAYMYSSMANGYVAAINAANTGLRRVDAVGFGAVLIKTKVFEKLAKPWFKFERFGEDIGFCHAARQAGFEVWCDSDLEIGHLGGRIEVNNAFVKAYRAGAGLAVGER